MSTFHAKAVVPLCVQAPTRRFQNDFWFIHARSQYGNDIMELIGIVTSLLS